MPAEPDPAKFADIAAKSAAAGIADESAAYDRAADDAPPSMDEGDPATTDDRSGTSETD